MRRLAPLRSPVAVAVVLSVAGLAAAVSADVPGRLARSLSGDQPPTSPRPLPPDGSHPAGAEGGEPTLFVSPKGTGSCRRSSPCGSIDEAYQQAQAGDVIELAPGRYPRQRVRPRQDAAGLASNVVVRAKRRGAATIDGALVLGPRLTLRGIRSTGEIALRPGADFSRLESIVIDGNVKGDATSLRGAAVGIGAHYTALVDSLVRGNVDQDLVKVQMGATDVLIEGNRIGEANVGPLKGHVDCLQVQGGHRIVIRRNVLYRCSVSALFISGRPLPVSDVLVEANFIQDCLVRTAGCRGPFAVYLEGDKDGGNPTRGVRFVHNTVDGAVSVEPEGQVGLEVKGNIIRELNSCGDFEDWNLIQSTRCPRLSPNDRIGTPHFVDRDKVDLRLRKGSSGVGFAGPAAPQVGIFGRERIGVGNAGADQGVGA